MAENKSRGVVYVICGARDLSNGHLSNSIESVRKHLGNININIWSDINIPDIGQDKVTKYESLHFDERMGNRNSSLFRLMALRDSDYENTLYLDNDIYIVNNFISNGFLISKDFGISMVENPRNFIFGPTDSRTKDPKGDLDIGADVCEMDKEALVSMPLGMTALNMGVIFYNNRSLDFLNCAIEEQQNIPSRGQAALARTIWKTKTSPYVLSRNWLVCRRDVGCETPIALHAGHSEVKEWWEKGWRDKPASVRTLSMEF